MSKNKWPCPGKPEDLKGQPIGMYHCEFCGEMQLAGVPHLPPQFPSQWEEPFPKSPASESPEPNAFPRIRIVMKDGRVFDRAYDSYKKEGWLSLAVNHIKHPEIPEVFCFEECARVIDPEQPDVSLLPIWTVRQRREDVPLPRRHATISTSPRAPRSSRASTKPRSSNSATGAFSGRETRSSSSSPNMLAGLGVTMRFIDGNHDDHPTLKKLRGRVRVRGVVIAKLLSMKRVDELIRHHRPTLHVHGHWYTRCTREHKNGTIVTGLNCNKIDPSYLDEATLLWSRNRTIEKE